MAEQAILAEEMQTPRKAAFVDKPYSQEERRKRDEEELEQLLKEQAGEGEEETEEVEAEPTNAEEKTFKKRYSDLRRHQQKQAEEFKAELSKCTLPAKISFTFVRGTKHKFDYINPAQTVQDDMVKAGWIEDDNAEFILPVFIQYTYDKQNPGVWIEILTDECNKEK